MVEVLVYLGKCAERGHLKYNPRIRVFVKYPFSVCIRNEMLALVVFHEYLVAPQELFHQFFEVLGMESGIREQLRVTIPEPSVRL